MKNGETPKVLIPTLFLHTKYLSKHGGNNKMKRFAALTLAALMLLTVFASAASAVPTTKDSIEIRGPVYNGSSINDIISTLGDAGATMDASNFAAFYYDP